MIFSNLVVTLNFFLFQQYHQIVSLDPYQAPCHVGPDLGPNCFAKVISRQH